MDESWTSNNPDHPTLPNLTRQNSFGRREIPPMKPWNETERMLPNPNLPTIPTLNMNPNYEQYWSYDPNLQRGRYEPSLGNPISNPISLSSFPQLPMTQLPLNQMNPSLHPSSPPKEELAEMASISSKREFNWTKIRKLSGWMHQTTNSVQQKELTEELTQKLYFSTLALLKYIGELKDPAEPVIFSTPVPTHPLHMNPQISQIFPGASVLPTNIRSIQGYPNAEVNNPQEEEQEIHPLPIQPISQPPSSSSSSQPSSSKRKSSSSSSSSSSGGQSVSVFKKRKAAKTNRNLYCFMCGVTDTPEWRRGPSGEHTLCNACGLQYAKSIRNLKNQQLQNSGGVASSSQPNASSSSSSLPASSKRKKKGSQNPSSNSPTSSNTTDKSDNQQQQLLDIQNSGEDLSSSPDNHHAMNQSQSHPPSQDQGSSNGEQDKSSE